MTKKQMSRAEIMARQNIDPGTLRDMARVGSYNVMEDLAAARFATGGPAPAIPEDRTRQVSRPVVGGGGGWRADTPFGHDGQHPTPGVAAADRIAEAFAERDRQAVQAETQGSIYERVLDVMSKVATMLLERSSEPKKK